MEFPHNTEAADSTHRRRRGRFLRALLLACAWAAPALQAPAADPTPVLHWIRVPQPGRIDDPLVGDTVGWIRSNAPARVDGTNAAWILGGDLAVSESELTNYVRSSLAPTITRWGLASVRRANSASSRESAGARALAGPAAFAFQNRLFSSGLSDASGSPIRWPETKTELVFCVSQASFPGPQYPLVSNAVAAAAADWNSASATLRFRYDPSQDTNPRKDMFGSPIGHDFVVVAGIPPFELPHAIALAFLPSARPHQRRIEVFPHYFEQSQYDPVGVFRHELGHVLGLVHEHNRTSGCPVDVFEAAARFRPLTPRVDTNSVMHYLCAGVGNRQWAITDQDILGLKVLYAPAPSFLDFLSPGTPDH